MTLLSQRLDLGNIRDVETVCEYLVSQSLSASAGHLSPADRDDAVTFLIAEAWVLWSRFDPSKGATFRTYAFPILRRRVSDWYRSRHGRGAARPLVVSTSELSESELDAAFRTGSRDDPAASYSDLTRVLAAGGGADGGLD